MRIATIIASYPDGRKCVIYADQDDQKFGDSDGGGTSLGNIRLETSDGFAVDRVSKGVYDVIHPRGPGGTIRVTSSDPNAP
jgi:hypothetical protein